MNSCKALLLMGIMICFAVNPHPLEAMDWSKVQWDDKPTFTIKLHGVPRGLVSADVVSIDTYAVSLDITSLDVASVGVVSTDLASADLILIGDASLGVLSADVASDLVVVAADPEPEGPPQKPFMSVVISGDQVIVKNAPQEKGAFAWTPSLAPRESRQKAKNENILPWTLPTSKPKGQDFLRPPMGMAWPMKGTLSSPFGKRGRRLHAGIDITGPKGTPVVAAADGTVAEVATGGKKYRGYGKTLIIRHGGDLTTLYAHCSSIKVKVGQTVRKGEVVASAGRTGRATTDQVHFEVRKQGKPVNPRPYLP